MSGVEHVEILVEEPSMEAALRILAPKVLGELSFEVYTHQGKTDLLARLPERLRGYASWLPKTWRIVVVVDREDDDCKTLKARLDAVAEDACLVSRAAAKQRPWQVVNRLAIEELEAWYFGDWEAVREAFPRVPATIPAQTKYRKPDGITGGTWEAFERVTQKAGYHAGGLRKIEAARAVARHMDPSRNTSPSFCALRDVLREMSVRAKLRVIVKRILRKYGYPPDMQERATNTVLQQAELLSDFWTDGASM
jgi:hypothetical protein